MDLIEVAKDYGILGLIILALFWYILRKDREHREERKEMMDVIARQHTESLEVTKNNTTVLTEISTLIRKGKR